MRVLVVEDDPSIAEPLSAGLERAGFEVTWVRDGASAFERVGEAEVVLLDLGLPDIDGTDVCRRLRATSDVPILVVSARGEEVDRVVLLELGADDYVTKPFGIRELIARIRAIARRSGGGEPAGAREFGGLRIDVASHRVSVDGEAVDLTPKEFDLLVHLSAETGRVHRRQEILESVWDEHWYGPTKTLDVHIASLRRKLGDPRWIETVRGVGYRFEPPA